MHGLVAILNPNADRGRAAHFASSLQQAACGHIDLTLKETTKRGEAADLARDAAERRSCDAVIAVGGDGTVHEVVNGLMSLPTDERPALGIIPAGSGNDVAYALGITKDLRRSIEMIQRGVTRAIDVGEARCSTDRVRYWVNNIGMLLEGQVNLVSHQLSWPRGSGLYFRALLQTLLRIPPMAHLELCLDGTASVRDAMVLSVSNGPRSGGKFILFPEASIDDGRFDYILASPMPRLRFIWEVCKSMRGDRSHDRRIERGQFSQMTIRSNIPLVAHVDGEPWVRPEDGICEIAIRVLPRALQVLCDSAL